MADKENKLTPDYSAPVASDTSAQQPTTLTSENLPSSSVNDFLETQNASQSDPFQVAQRGRSIGPLRGNGPDPQRPRPNPDPQRPRPNPDPIRPGNGPDPVRPPMPDPVRPPNPPDPIRPPSPDPVRPPSPDPVRPPSPDPVRPPSPDPVRPPNPPDVGNVGNGPDFGRTRGPRVDPRRGNGPDPRRPERGPVDTRRGNGTDPVRPPGIRFDPRRGNRGDRGFPGQFDPRRGNGFDRGRFPGSFDPRRGNGHDHDFSDQNYRRPETRGNSDYQARYGRRRGGSVTAGGFGSRQSADEQIETQRARSKGIERRSYRDDNYSSGGQWSVPDEGSGARLSPNAASEYQFKSGWVRKAIADGLITPKDMQIATMDNYSGRFYYAGEQQYTRKSYTASIKSEERRLMQVLEQKRTADPSFERKIAESRESVPKTYDTRKGLPERGFKDVTTERVNPLMSKSERERIAQEKASYHERSKEVTSQIRAEEQQEKKLEGLRNFASWYVATDRPTRQQARRLIELQMSGDLPTDMEDLKAFARGEPGTAKKYSESFGRASSRTRMSSTDYNRNKSVVEDGGINELFYNDTMPFLEQYSYDNASSRGKSFNDIPFAQSANSVTQEEARKGLLLLAERHMEAGQHEQLKDLKEYAKSNAYSLGILQSEIDTLFDPKLDALKGSGNYQLAENEKAAFQVRVGEAYVEQAKEIMKNPLLSPDAYDRYLANLQAGVDAGRIKQEHFEAVLALKESTAMARSTETTVETDTEAEVRTETQTATKISKEQYAEAKRIGSSTRYLLDLYAKGTLGKDTVNSHLKSLKKDLENNPEVQDYLAQKLYSTDPKTGAPRYKIDPEVKMGILNFLTRGDSTQAVDMIAQKNPTTTGTDQNSLASIQKDIRRMNIILNNLAEKQTELDLINVSKKVAERISDLSPADKQKFFASLRPQNINDRNFLAQIYIHYRSDSKKAKLIATEHLLHKER